jgi:pimeloyl-ACP methyl ester carboxylesterase
MAATLTDHQPAGTSADPKPEARGHIGRIVAGSLIGGLVAAIFLVAVPFAGAPEHVITGSVLLAFGGAWAALASFSVRRTDQPQRWAFVPAVFMGVAGLVVLAVAPTGNEAGWVWPAAVVALVVWMVRAARRDLHSRTRAWVLYPVCAALLLSAVGGTFETYHESTTHLAMPGRLIDVGGHELHINCVGTGSPTVVLEPGLGEPSPAMAWVTADVAKTTRVCVYDRAGRGWSESAGHPLDGVQTATDLHTLLTRAGEHGPFVLAGHSAGGIYVINFARLFPRDVAGVVLLDSMTPEQYTKISGWPAFYEGFRRFSAIMPSLSRFGVARLVNASAFGDLPPQAARAERAFWSTPRHARSERDEFSEIRTALTQAQSLKSLANTPLVVVTAEKGEQGGWADAQNELVRLSTNSVHEFVPATHEMVTADEHTAARSSNAIDQVINAVRAGKAL